MGFFQFLTTYSKVDTVIGLLAFLIAAVLGYFAYRYSIKVSKIGDIISKANTQSKADLVTSIFEVMPAYRIPDLSEDHGFEVVKLQLSQREKEFAGKIKTLRLVIILFSVLVLAIIGKNYFSFQSYTNTTYGPMSPIDNNHSSTSFKTTSKDTVK